MASSHLVLPGVLFVGEDERARVVAHVGPAAGWFVPKGILGWSTEVSLVARDALTDDIRRLTKIVMPEEQIPQAKMPLTRQAALKAPLVAVSSKITSKLVESNVRVHTIGVDRITSSFYYIADGGGEDTIQTEGDLVAAVGAMLGERADNAAIERVMDGIVDRLVRSISRDRVTELGIELAAALPRAAADGRGTDGVDLEAFEKELSELIGGSEKYTALAQQIATALGDLSERRLTVPLFGEARKVSQGPFELSLGDKKVQLGTYERWVMSGPLTEPPANEKPAAKPVSVRPAAAAPVAAPAPKPAPAPAPAAKVEPKPEPKPAPVVEAKPEPKPEPRPASAPAIVAQPIVDVKPIIAQPIVEVKAAEPKSAPAEPVAAKVEEPKKAEPEPAPKPAAKKAEEPAPAKKAAAEPAKAKKAAAEPAAKATPKKSEATTVKIVRDDPKKSGMLPWIIVIVLAAAAFGAWRFLFHG